MTERIPFDVSDCPDADRPATPEASTDGESSSKAAPAMPADRRRRGGLATLIVLALVALATVFVVRELHLFVDTSFLAGKAYGWASLTLVVVLGALVLLAVGRQVRGYFRLASFDRLRTSLRELDAAPNDPRVNRQAQHEIKRYLRYLERRADADLIARIGRFRERMALADDAREWQDDLERVLLVHMDEQVQQAIRQEAMNVGIGTAVSPYGTVDAIISLWRDVRLIRRIAGIYRVRAGAYGTWRLMRRTLAAVALADLTQEATTAAIGGISGLLTFLGSVTQGITNAALTIRIGLRAQEQCRPMALTPEQKQGLAFTLLRTVGTAVVKMRGKKADGGAGEPS